MTAAGVIARQKVNAYHYFAVCGDCSYIVSDRPSGEVRTGQLDQDRSARLSTEVGFEKVAAWSAFEDVESCPDAGTITLRTPVHSVLCTCGCGPEAPAGLEEALQAAFENTRALWNSGQPLSGPVSVVGYTPPDNIAWFKSALTPQDWPLSSSIDLVLVEDASVVDRSTGIRFEQGQDSAKLRALRQSAAEQAQFVQSIPVRAADGVVHALLVRDELPKGFSDLPEFVR